MRMYDDSSFVNPMSLSDVDVITVENEQRGTSDLGSVIGGGLGMKQYSSVACEVVDHCDE